jgi:hypothetical protein
MKAVKPVSAFEVSRSRVIRRTVASLAPLLALIVASACGQGAPGGAGAGRGVPPAMPVEVITLQPAHRTLNGIRRHDQVAALDHGSTPSGGVCHANRGQVR